MNAPDLATAALAGLLSFLSPCVLPLVPAYLSIISGTSAGELRSGGCRGRVFIESIAFSLGFTLAFTLMGIAFSGGAMFVGGGGRSRAFAIGGGLVVILLGLNMMFGFARFLSRDSRLIIRIRERLGARRGGSFLLGLAFAAGWSPCIGPLLASILIFAGREGNLPRAALLLASYSLGFALPFLATGLFFDRLSPLLGFFRKRGQAVRIGSGIVLVVFGLVMALGSLGRISAWASATGYRILSFAELSPRIAKAWGLALWFSLSAVSILPALLARTRARTRASTQPRPAILVLAGVFAALGVAELSGLFMTFRVLARWLTFSGI